MRSRSVKCVDSLVGATVSDTWCSTSTSVSTVTSDTRPAFTEACNTDACVTPYWQHTGRWSACSHPCMNADGSGGVGVSTRPPAQCMQDGVAVSELVCTSFGLAVPTTSKVCNCFVCPDQVVQWRVSSWSLCVSASGCGVGSSTRDVKCVDGSGTVVSDDNKCVSLSPKPISTASCDTGVTCGCVTDEDCLFESPSESESIEDGGSVAPRRRCDVDGGRVCVCVSGWTGSGCDVIELSSSTGSDGASPTVSCGAGVIDASGACCENVVDSDNGLCCDDGDVLDGEGRCCSGEVDVCGVCDGSGVAVDANGDCCDKAVSLMGVCCGGEVDNCGVCAGSNQCGVDVDVEMSVLSGADGNDSSASLVSLSSLASALDVDESMLLTFSVTSGNDSSSSGSRRRVLQSGTLVRCSRQSVETSTCMLFKTSPSPAMSLCVTVTVLLIIPVCPLVHVYRCFFRSSYHLTPACRRPT